VNPLLWVREAPVVIYSRYESRTNGGEHSVAGLQHTTPSQDWE